MTAAATGWDVMGRRVVVTGASSGLGLVMARALADAGARVALTGRDLRRVRAALATLSGGRGDALALAMDVRDRASITRAVAEIDAAWGGLDVLVNNAGIGMRTVNPVFLSEPQPFWQVSEEGFTAVIDTNLTGYFRVAAAAFSVNGRFGGVAKNLVQDIMRLAVNCLHDKEQHPESQRFGVLLFVA